MICCSISVRYARPIPINGEGWTTVRGGYLMLLRRFAAIAALLASSTLSPPRLGAQDAGPGVTDDAGVTYDDILQGLSDPSRWLTFSGDYSGQRHSPLAQITPENVHRLVP